MGSTTSFDPSSKITKIYPDPTVEPFLVLGLLKKNLNYITLTKGRIFSKFIHLSLLRCPDMA
jgi:hypothetical protein